MSSSLLSDVLVFDKKLQKNLDVFYLFLLDSAENTILPELYELFDADQVSRLIERFAGTTIKFPKKHIITRAARRAEIYSRVSDGESVESVARKFTMTTEDVIKVLNRYRRLTSG